MKYRQDNDKANETVQHDISELKRQRTGLNKQGDTTAKASVAVRKISQMQSLREAMMQDAKAIQQRYTDIAAEQWNGETVCPRCKRPLPEIKLHTHRRHITRQK